MFRRTRQLARRVRQGKAFATAVLLQIVLVNAFILFAGPAVRADDCSSDWRRAEDCLRTPGFAQTLGTTAGVIGTILINGMAIQTLVLKPRGTGGQEGEHPPDKQYFLDVRTEGARTTLVANGQETLWIYARVVCSDPEVDCTAITSGISFDFGGRSADWIKLVNQDAGEFKAIQIGAIPAGSSTPGEKGEATVDVTAICEEARLTANVPLELGSVEYALEFL